METLQKKMPLLTDNLGKPLAFETWQFELIESDLTDCSKHVVAIHFLSPALHVHHQVGEFLVLSQQETADENQGFECFTIRMQPQLSISWIGDKNSQNA